MKKLKLSVLDQSPVHDGKADRFGLLDTIELAKICDTLGYHRYWLAEHHNTTGYASCAPEIMINSVATATQNMRIGSGGVMLNHYSAFKVAETFNMLEALHPGRIDVGIGRAPGSDFMTSRALGGNREIDYSQKAYDLIGYLNQNLDKNHPFFDVALTPTGLNAPPVYLLGSSEGSSQLAGVLGAGFVLALFIGNHERTPEIIKEYKKSFIPSTSFEAPKAMIAVACIVADSKEEAEFIASSHLYWKLQAATQYKREPLKSPEELVKIIKNLSDVDRQYYEESKQAMVLGTAKECQEKLAKLAAFYDVDEVLIVNVTYHFKDRVKSYQLLAQ
ncbi:LLM class flavin-dependent oxidoreductase [Sulfurospirillum sp. 1612]|uniref:LLM class flavin-dependent oxidoreductase n=1 Tax=Sulfurospirillum sp. 1612 TaxID=3094835 RepID=UPI002F92E0A8